MLKLYDFEYVGISLTQDQWEKLKAAMPDIDEWIQSVNYRQPAGEFGPVSLSTSGNLTSPWLKVNVNPCDHLANISSNSVESYISFMLLLYVPACTHLPHATKGTISMLQFPPHTCS